MSTHVSPRVSPHLRAISNLTSCAYPAGPGRSVVEARDDLGKLLTAFKAQNNCSLALELELLIRRIREELRKTSR
jgi:hypothetical protein